MEADKTLLSENTSSEKIHTKNGNSNTNNSSKSDDIRSLTSEESYQESERFGCCSIFSAWPWKRLIKPQCNRPTSKKKSSTYYRKFSADQDIPSAELLEPVSQPGAGTKESPLHGKDAPWRSRTWDDDEQPSAKRTPFTSNRSKHNGDRMQRSPRHRSMGSVASGQLSAHLGGFNEFQTDSEDGLSIDLHGLEKMAAWRYSLDTQTEGWWYDYDDFPMMDESCTTLCTQKNNGSRESIPIWERDTTGNIVLRRLKRNGRHSSSNGSRYSRSTSSAQTSPTDSNASDKSSKDGFIMHKSRPSRTVSVRSEDVTLGVVQEEEDVFTSDIVKPSSTASLARQEDSFDSEAELMGDDELSADMATLSISEHDALHSSGNYTSSEDGMLPLELQDEIAAIDELTRRADIAEELRISNKDDNVEINTRSLYDELYEEPDSSDYEGQGEGHALVENYTEPLMRDDSSDVMEETAFQDDLEDDADEPLIGDGIVLQIAELENVSEQKPITIPAELITPDGTDESSNKLQRRLSSVPWTRSANVRRLTSSQSEPTGRLHLLAMDSVPV